MINNYGTQAIDPVWEKLHSAQAWGMYPSEHVIRFVARNYYSAPDRNLVKILDFGCGQGANTWFLSREGFDTYAFDGSASAVEKAVKKLEQEQLPAHFSVQNGNHLTFENDFFDAVIDNVCIYANSSSFIHEMYSSAFRVLKAGGRLFTVVFGECLDGYRTGEEIEPNTFVNIQEGLLAERGVSHIFTREEIVNTLVQTGFQHVVCEESKYTDRGYLVHHYMCSAQKES